MTDATPELPGRRPLVSGRPTVLVCGHIVDAALFGAERSLVDLLRGFGSIGFNTVVVVPSPPADPAYLEEILERCARVHAMPVPRRDLRRAPDEAVVAGFARLLARDAFDAVHTNTITPREPLIAARRAGIPAVVHAREIVSHDPDLCAWLGGSPEALARSVVEEADYVIANSMATAACYPTLGRTSIVPNTVDLDALGAARGEREGPVRVALVGNTTAKKGLCEFLDVARLLESRVDARFVVVGPDSPLVRRLRGVTPGNVVLAGYAAGPRQAMEQADVVVNLSTCRESFGRTVLEAMASRLPVVAFDWGAVPELVRDGETGFLVPFGDVVAAARRIERLCREAALRRQMGDAGRRVAEERFSSDALARALRSSYAPILRARETREETLADVTIALPCLNNSRFEEPFYVENRARFAHCTGVKLLDEHRLVCTSLIGQRMYLVRFDVDAGTSSIEACIHTRDRHRDVSTDLLDFDGGTRLLTSNCEHRSVSLYRLTANGIAFDDALPLDDPAAGYCHGAKFVPGRPDLVCATTTTRGNYVYIVSLDTRRPVYRFADGDWLPKDLCFVGPRLVAITQTNRLITQLLGASNRSKVSLVALGETFDAHAVIDELFLDGTQVDGCHARGDHVYVADQTGDVVHVLRVVDRRLRRERRLGGFQFPHAVDTSARGDLLAVANYGPNTVTLRPLASPPRSRGRSPDPDTDP